MEAHMQNPGMQAGASRNQLGGWLHSNFYQTVLANTNPTWLFLPSANDSAGYVRTLFAGVTFR